MQAGGSASDLDELLADPVGYLGSRAITLRTNGRGAGGLLNACSFWLGVLILCIAFAWAVAGPREILALSAAVVAGLALVSWRGRRMYAVRWDCCVLDAAGVRFVEDGGREVFCPWALFSAPGPPAYRTDGHGRRFAAELPVQPAAAPLVEAREGGRVVARGLGVKTWQFRFLSPRAVLLTGFYQPDWQVLSGLLLLLGRNRGREGESGAAPSAGDG
jgi:hypothetical protein